LQRSVTKLASGAQWYRLRAGRGIMKVMWGRVRREIVGLSTVLFAVILGSGARAVALPRCVVVSTSSIGFGAYESGDSKPVDSTGSVVFECEEVGSSDMVAIEISRSRAGSFQPRAMTGPSPSFEYNLYLDAARTVVWGDGSAGTSVYRVRPVSGRTVSVPIYGRIPPRQNVRAGRYSDVVIITLMF
jgi:spore coat protein U-like protein